MFHFRGNHNGTSATRNGVTSNNESYESVKQKCSLIQTMAKVIKQGILCFTIRF